MITRFISNLLRVLRRARGSILIVAVTYLLSLIVGITMVHTGNDFALSYRDRLVAEARSGPVLAQSNPLSMALADFAGNLRGAVVDALGGLGVVFPFPLVAYRGWVGGIVSVDGSHASRLLNPTSSAYYLSVVFLQLTAYTLAAGAGVNAGLSFWRGRPEYAGRKWLGLPTEALRDLGRIFCSGYSYFSAGFSLGVPEPMAMTAEQALDLWLTVPRLPISKRERRVLEAAENFTLPFTSTVRPTGEFTLPVTAWGEAGRRLVLLMHGWGGHRGQLTGFVAPLMKAGFRVVAFDAPAHGDAPGKQASGFQMAAAMRIVLEKAGQPYAIVAHSIGTMVVTVALQHWLEVEKLVFSGPTRRLEDTLEPYLKMNGLPLEMAAEFRRLTEQSWGSDVWQRTSLDLVLPKFNTPALIFHDRDDETTPYISGVGVARAWPSARLVTTHGLGHRGALKDPEVIRQVVEFIKL